MSAEAKKGLDKATFVDDRWSNAIKHLRSKGLLRSLEDASALLLQGAKAFGMWSMSDRALNSLVDRLLELPEEGMSAGLGDWFKESSSVVKKKSLMKRASTGVTSLRGTDSKTLSRRTLTDKASDHVSFVDKDAMRTIQYVLLLLLTVVCTVNACYVVIIKHDGALENFLWPLVLARSAGLGTAVITGLLYLTMSRHAIRWLCNIAGGGGSLLRTALDGHKDLHMFLAVCLYGATVVHILAHLFSTVPAIAHLDATELNALLGCASWDEKLAGWPRFKWLEWPACPLEREFDQGWEVLVESTVGLSGIVLTLHLLLVGLSGREAARRRRFDYFWYLHNTIIVLFPIVMFIHGSNQWMGVGFPLIAFTGAVPIFLYSIDRAMRVLRYYANRNVVRIRAAVVRPGKDGKSKGALTKLVVEKPKWFWSFKSGMYAFINLPEYAAWQWHPFTITSGGSDDYVEFIVAGVGDWSQELTRMCMEANQAGRHFPAIALDGPFAAPSQSALSKSVLVAIGAGVGITPFLANMAGIIQNFEDSETRQTSKAALKEAHFFWMSRSIDEFLFARQHLTKIANSPSLRKRLHFHLHVTGKEIDGDSLSFLFRECVKRQSKLDRAAFEEHYDSQSELLANVELPWCWANGSKKDVMWLSDLVATDAEDEGDAACVETLADWAGTMGAEQAATLPPADAPAQAWADPRGRLVPVAFGRPDFETELRAIGKYWGSEAINMYICGNDAIVKQVQDIAAKLNEEAVVRARATMTRAQSYAVNFERFG